MREIKFAYCESKKKLSLMQYKGDNYRRKTYIWVFCTYMNSQYLWNELSKKNVDNAWK